jgi:hypothetical protein
MSDVRIRPEWDYPDLSAAIAKARRDDPEYDRIWREGLQRMADEWDMQVFEAVYPEIQVRLKPKAGE